MFLCGFDQRVVISRGQQINAAEITIGGLADNTADVFGSRCVTNASNR